MNRFLFFLILGFISTVTTAWCQFGNISGKVVEKDNKQPLVGVNVIIKGTQMGAATDNDGNYVIEKVPVGAYILDFSFIGCKKKNVPSVIVKTNKTTYVNAALTWEALEGEEIAVTAGYFDQPEDAPASVQTLNYEEIRRSPGSSEDVSRMLQNFAGVNFTSDDRNDLVIRGGSPAEVLFEIDNIEVPNPNHFGTQGATGGPISMINAEFIEDVQFMAGGFTASYGNKLSGVMAIGLREGDRQACHGKLDLNMAGAGGYFEGPIGDKRGSFLIGLHRSYLDLFKDLMNYGGVPIYSNIQGKIVFDLNKNHQITALWIGGDDKIEMDYETDADDFKINQTDTTEYQKIDFRSRQLTAGATLRSFWSKDFYTLLSLSHSYNHFFTDVNALDVSGFHDSAENKILNETEINTKDMYDNISDEQISVIKLDGTWSLNRYDALTFGASANLSQFDYDIVYYPSKPDELNSFGVKPTPFTVNFNQSITPKFGSYLNYKNRFKDRFVLNIGGRYDYFKLIDDGDFSPRISLLIDVTERLNIHAGIGRYFQNPEFIHIMLDPANKNNLTNIQCDHFIVGLNYLLNPGTRMTVEIYRKNYANYPVASDSGYSMISMANSGADYGISGGANGMVSEGEGKATGIEFTLHQKLIDKFYGLVSYSYSDIQHKALDGVFHNGAFDNRNVFNLVMGYRQSKSWEYSLKWRYAGGRPYTPFDYAASIASGEGRYDLTRINSERYAPYHRLDLRFDHREFYKFGTIISYLSIENVYMRENQLSHYWNKAQNKTSFTHQIGLFVVGGVSVEF